MTKFQMKTFLAGMILYFVSTIVLELSIPNHPYKNVFSYLFLFLFLAGGIIYNKKMVSKQKKMDRKNQEDERFHQVRNTASWYTLLVLIISGMVFLLVFNHSFDAAILQIIRIIFLYTILIYFLAYLMVGKRM